MIYAEVIFGVLVDWRTMEIQTNSKMGPLTSMTILYERKFRRDTLRKRARKVEILYNKVKWSKTSSNDSHTRCDLHVCKEFEYSFKYSWLEAKLNKEPIILEEDDQEGNPLKKDAISNKRRRK